MALFSAVRVSTGRFGDVDPGQWWADWILNGLLGEKGGEVGVGAWAGGEAEAEGRDATVSSTQKSLIFDAAVEKGE